MHVSSVRGLTIGETTVCALVADALRERAFAGDHRAMTRWAESSATRTCRCWNPRMCGRHRATASPLRRRRRSRRGTVAALLRPPRHAASGGVAGPGLCWRPHERRCHAGAARTPSAAEPTRRTTRRARWSTHVLELNATREILRLVATSRSDAQPVFEAIARLALELCHAYSANVFTYDGRLVHIGALAIVDPKGIEAMRSIFPRPASRETGACRAVLTRQVEMIPDVTQDPDFSTSLQAVTAGFRSVLAVPLMHGDTPIGAIAVGRPEPGPFPARQLALLQTFAEQAVVAIENARQFREVEARNRELAEALQQQTATSEILRVISRSPTEVQCGLRHHRGRSAAAVRSRFGQRPDLRRRVRAPRCHRRGPSGSCGAGAPDVSAAARPRHRRVSRDRSAPRRRHRERARRPGVHVQVGRRGRFSQRRRHSAAARRRADRGDRRRPPRDRPVSAAPAGAVADLRRPGRDRHRQRAPVPRARGTQSRPGRSARAADRHGRHPARDLAFDQGHAAGVRHDRRGVAQAVRRTLGRRLQVRRQPAAHRGARTGASRWDARFNPCSRGHSTAAWSPAVP